MTGMSEPHASACPADLELVRQTGQVRFYYSEQEQKFYLEMHGPVVGRIPLSRADIRELSGILDKKAGEREQELIQELEQDDDDF